MKRQRPASRLSRHVLYQGAAVLGLCAIGFVAFAGPSGVLAWSENQRLLESRQAALVQMTRQRDELKNRVDLLDPRHADADLTGELLRSRLGVAHPDEEVLLLP